MSMYNIKKGVPIPSIYGAGRKKKYPFDTMHIGDCFEVSDQEIHRVRAAVQYTQRNGNRQFVTRQTGPKVFTIWRKK